MTTLHDEKDYELATLVQRPFSSAGVRLPWPLSVPTLRATGILRHNKRFHLFAFYLVLRVLWWVQPRGSAGSASRF